MMAFFFLTMVYLGVVVGVYVKLTEYGLRKKRLYWSIFLPAHILKGNLVFSYRHSLGKESERQTSLHHNVTMFFSLFMRCMQDFPVFVAVFAYVLADIQSQVYTYSFHSIKEPTANLYSEISRNVGLV